MPPLFNRNPRRNAAAGKEVEHHRAWIRQRANQPLDHLARLLCGMPDAFFRIAVQPRHLPHVGGIAAFLHALGAQSLVLAIGGFCCFVVGFANRIQVEVVLRGLAEPGDLFVTVGKEALRAHAVRVIPHDEVREQHRAVLAQVLDECEQIARAGFRLVLKPAEQCEASSRCENALRFGEPL